MSEKQLDIQVFKDYSIDFTTNVPLVNEVMAREVIKYLYKVDMSEMKIKDIQNNEEIDKTNDDYDYAIQIGLYSHNSISNKYIIGGMVVSSKDKVPYLFLANSYKISYWKTDIENYDGDFSITNKSFMVERNLGIDIKGTLHLPRKSAFLLGKYEDVIFEQSTTEYTLGSDNVSYVFVSDETTTTTSKRENEKNTPNQGMSRRRKLFKKEIIN